MTAAIGIDLGTTFSCVAAFHQGKVEIIANSIGNRKTPNYVAFNDTGRLIGEPAKRQAAINLKNTFVDSKRLVGRYYKESLIEADKKHWPFDVIVVDTKLKLQAEIKGELKKFPPEMISSMILVKMKETAEAFLGTKVKDAVITVPASFNNCQRQATIDAGTIAGLNVLRIINEPTAAALAFGLQKGVKGERNVLIYHLGGGTFDVTILTITDGSVFNVKSTCGDSHLGGQDLDNIIVQYLVKKFIKKHRSQSNVQKDPRAMYHLRIAAERAKRDLSASITASVDIYALYEGIDFSITMSRDKLNKYCLKLFSGTLDSVQQALADAKMTKESIDEIVLVGGSTRLPKVQELLKEFFPGKTLNLSINPDEAAAYGAAVQAAILSGGATVFNDVILVDVVPCAIGANSPSSWIEVIRRNTQVPHKKIVTLPFQPKCNEWRIKLYEEKVLTKNGCQLIGHIRIYFDPPKCVKKSCEFTVVFNLDTNGMVSISLSLDTQQIKATLIKGNLLPAEIKELCCQTERFKAEDNQELERMSARNDLEVHVYKVKMSSAHIENSVDDGSKNSVKDSCKNVLEWLEAYPQATKKEYEDKLKQFKADLLSASTQGLK